MKQEEETDDGICFPQEEEVQRRASSFLLGEQESQVKHWMVDKF